MADVHYPIVVVQLHEDDGDGFMAYAPDLKGCMGDGATQAEALKDCQDAIIEWIAEAKRLGRVIPEPGSGIRRAKAAREALLDKIQTQSASIEQMDKDINQLRGMLKTITDRMLDDPMMWAASIPYFTSRQQVPDDAVH